MTDDHNRYEYRLALYDDDVFFGNISAGSTIEYLEQTIRLATESHPETFRQVIMRRPWVSDIMYWGDWIEWCRDE